MPTRVMTVYGTRPEAIKTPMSGLSSRRFGIGPCMMF